MNLATSSRPSTALRCGQLSLTVASLERAVGFYTRVCGLEVKTAANAGAETVRLGTAGGPEAGEEGFGLLLRQGRAAAVIDQLSFDCDSPADVDRIADHAQRRGHLVCPPVLDASSGDYVAIVNDPDANRLVFRVPGAASRRSQQQAAARRPPRWALGLSLGGGVAGLSALVLLVLGQLPAVMGGALAARWSRSLAVASLLLVTGIFWALAWQGQLAGIRHGRPRLARTLWLGWLSLYAAPAAVVLLLAGWLVSPIDKPAAALSALAEGRWRAGAAQLLPSLGRGAAGSLGALVGATGQAPALRR